MEDAVREGHRLKIGWAIKCFMDAARRNANDAKYKRVFGDKFLPLTEEFIERLCKIKWHGNWYGRVSEVRQKPFAERRRIKCAQGYFNANSAKSIPLFEAKGIVPNYKCFLNTYYIEENGTAITVEHPFKDLVSICDTIQTGEAFGNKTSGKESTAPLRV